MPYSSMITRPISLAVEPDRDREWRPVLPRLSIGPLDLGLDGSKRPPSSAATVASSVLPTTPPPAYFKLGGGSLEKQRGYLTPPHAQVRGSSESSTDGDIESVYQIQERGSFIHRLQTNQRIRMLAILLISFLIVSGIAIAVVLMLAKKK
ncbi:hypothetical protein TWF696_009729 [Orbilia brochopaga]|uniref:Uncharacterized protein n=1 Tax=Orbilia brochopaga TaxID=3140254 RepID=A0AAV9UFN5_9PEZI